jgi:hypothetical protein
MRDHVTFVPESVREQLRCLAEELKTGGVNGAVELILRETAVTADSLAERVAQGFRVIPEYLGEEWVRLPVTVTGEHKAAIEEAAAQLGVQRMRLLGTLLTAAARNPRDLAALITGGRARSAQSEEEEDVAVAVEA